MKGLEALEIIKEDVGTKVVFKDFMDGKEITIYEYCNIIEKELKKLEKLELAFSLLRQHIRLYNIRGECSLTMNGIAHKEISEELYNSLLEIFYEIKVADTLEGLKNG